MNDIERTWNEEVRDKKRAGSGVRGKKGKRGYVRGGVKTPVDLLSGRERREYMGTSPVRTVRTGTVEPIIPYEEYKALGKQAKTLALYKLRAAYSVRELAEAWGISDKSVYYQLRARGVQPGSQAPDETERAEEGASGHAASTESCEEPAPTQPEPEGAAASTECVEARSEGECSFTLAGELGALALDRKLRGLSAMHRGRRRSISRRGKPPAGGPRTSRSR